MNWEAGRLDDPRWLEEGDPSGMLRAVASSAAQLRTSYRAAREAGVSSLARDGRPRAVVVAGMGGSGIAGDVLAAVCGHGAPLPIVTVRSYRLPGWVGATDLVIAVSCSGSSEETLAAATEAVRRGCRLLAVGGPGSALEAIARQAGAPFVPVASGGQPRAGLWALSVPLLAAAAELGLLRVDEETFETVAGRLEEIANRCRPVSESFINPGKSLAMELAETIPMVWGSSPLAAVAAHRWACQLNENGKYPAIWGEIPETGHNQVVTFDGPLAERDIFADEAGRSLRLFVLRDAEEHPQVTRRREASVRLAHDRNVPVTEIAAEGTHPLERLASLIGLGDYASTYLALGYGIDPTPVSAITELKTRISQ
ncbi:SIS domain-containing protein [Planomonospora parontospora]|uniref:SIS domain-containing protein n=1 Tax=Planomonospora parontospora TaxID=58119 RepID=UPI0016716D89|nr:SIS domain-containing protein [Planomonospora parontospora]GGL09064.1 bifunctional glucose-6-phosphate/mannose-6-phosphate isomerase [Planomonospora parontospora subsp. antibiotica]GII14449.1 bifunctional glucose-6-phosphate/mannose-6-phosphate isomerase [Planomonospora parontospora subsp. antibiotica]